MPKPMQPFRGVDYLLIDTQLDAQERLVRQTAREFVEGGDARNPRVLSRRALPC
jgi:hypothetical protein